MPPSKRTCKYHSYAVDITWSIAILPIVWLLGCLLIGVLWSWVWLKKLGVVIVTVDRYAKAIIGALVAALGAVQVALVSPGVTSTEWVTVAIAFLAGLGFIWAVPNAPADNAAPKDGTGT